MSCKQRGAGRAAVLLTAALLFASGLGVLAQEAGGSGQAVPADPVAATAHAALEKHCARCHQVGRTGEQRPHGGIGNILALEDLVRHGTLVRAGEPEASPLFNVMYSGHAPLGLFLAAATGEPASHEIAAVRDWIRQLPRDASPCTGSKPLGPRHAEQQVSKFAASAGTNAAQLRFVSLVHLHDACATEAELTGYRAAVAWLVNAASGSSPLIVPQAIDEAQTILKLDLNALGWSAAQWEELVALFPLARLPPARVSKEAAAALGSSRPVVNADWFAAAVRSAEMFARLRPGGDDAGFLQQLAAGGLARDDALALGDLYEGLVGPRRAAAELGLSVAALGRALNGVKGPATAAAQRLRQGAVSRRDALIAYAALLDGGPGAIEPALIGPAKAGAMTLAIWPDADSYKVGDAAVFYVEASDDCYLTLVNVDSRGRATVLFPNELEKDNALKAQRRISLPPSDGAYRFRVSEKGRETLVGICTETPRPIDGIWHDFDRLRFTVLGEWESFQIRAYEDAGKPPLPLLPRDRQVRRRGQPAKEIVLPEKRGLEPQARAAVSFEVR